MIPAVARRGREAGLARGVSGTSPTDLSRLARERVSTMVRARRHTLIAVVIAAGLLALTGCRTDPDVAAYVGGTTIQNARVDRIVEEAIGTLPAKEREDFNKDALRDQVVQLLVVRAVIDNYAGKNDFTVPAADADAFAQQQGLPVGVEFTTLAAEFNAGLSALSARAKPVPPTVADQREAYENAEIQGQALSKQASFDEAKQVLTEETLGAMLGLRKLITSAAEDAGVTINPRHNIALRLPVQLAQEQQVSSWFAVPLTGAAPVRDLPLPLPVASQGASGQE